MFDDKNKSQWIFWGKKQHGGCVKKQFCSKMIVRNNEDMDICLLEMREDVIETGRMNNVMLRSICLPDQEPAAGSSCFTSGINRDSKKIDPVPLNLFTYEYCDNHSVYSQLGTSLNENQLCAGLPSNTNYTAPFNGEHEEDFGGPLICLDKDTQRPIFTGVASSNSLSTRKGQPGMIQKSKKYDCDQPKVWVRIWDSQT